MSLPGKRKVIRLRDVRGCLLYAICVIVGLLEGSLCKGCLNALL